MRIKTFQVENYKSFLDSGEVFFAPGFNVIVGQNNVGKTTFIEALSLRFSNKPHRSLERVSYGESEVKISIELDSGEFLDILSKQLSNFNLPIGGRVSSEVQVEKFLGILPQRNVVKCVFRGGQLYSAHLPLYSEEFSGLAGGTHVNAIQFSMIPGSDIPSRMGGSSFSTSHRDTVAMQLADLIRQRIYAFDAERFNIGESGIGTNPALAPNASDLPRVLHLLQSSNPNRFQKFIKFVKDVFPEIKSITVPPYSGNNARVLIWHIDPSTERADLAIPLSESGTGIGQVLAILYVVINSDFPRAIIIDEPQSFLHPGAVRKVFEILKNEYSQHQYIVTTHSPVAITAADPSKLFMVRKEENESRIEIIDIEKTEQIRFFLLEIGARLSDVFGADNILWVEGRTEELCFPIILSLITKLPIMGTAIIGVLQVGDFERRDSERIVRIYNRLSESKGLLPPAIGFIFDRECRSSQEIEDIQREGKGKVSFLDRRMFENYLVSPSAIAEVMSNIEDFREAPVKTGEIELWLQKHRWEKEYFCSPLKEKDKTDVWWLKIVDGAKILEDLFKQFSDNRVTYRKVEHGVALTKWISENAPNDFTDIVTLLRNALGGNSDPQKNNKE